MLLVSENGTGYADGHFHADNGLIINNFTGRMVGRLISTKETTCYMCCDPRFQRPLTRWQKIKRWFSDQQVINDTRAIPDEAVGSLADTMKGLER